VSVSPTSELSGVCLPAAGNRDMADRPRGPAVLVQARRFLAGIARRPSKYASQTGGLQETRSRRGSCPFGQGKSYCTGRLNRFREERHRLISRRRRTGHDGCSSRVSAFRPLRRGGDVAGKCLHPFCVITLSVCAGEGLAHVRATAPTANHVKHQREGRPGVGQKYWRRSSN